MYVSSPDHGVDSANNRDKYQEYFVGGGGVEGGPELTAPADLSGLVRFAERRNLVSARVPSHFKRSLR